MRLWEDKVGENPQDRRGIIQFGQNSNDNYNANNNVNNGDDNNWELIVFNQQNSNRSDLNNTQSSTTNNNESQSSNKSSNSQGSQCLDYNKAGRDKEGTLERASRCMELTNLYLSNIWNTRIRRIHHPVQYSGTGGNNDDLLLPNG